MWLIHLELLCKRIIFLVEDTVTKIFFIRPILTVVTSEIQKLYVFFWAGNGIIGLPGEKGKDTELEFWFEKVPN